MAKKIITISREFGSGGRFIGEEVRDYYLRVDISHNVCYYIQVI